MVRLSIYFHIYLRDFAFETARDKWNLDVFLSYTLAPVEMTKASDVYTANIA